jgi:hypothetical protein
MVDRHLLTDCLENVGASTFHNPVCFHGMLQYIAMNYYEF